MKLAKEKTMINKELDYNHKFYLSQDGYAITEPMTGAEIVAKFGPAGELRLAGIEVVPV